MIIFPFHLISFFSFLVRSWLNVTQRYFNPLQYLNVYWPIDFSFQLITRLSIQVEMCEMKCNHALRLEISCENPLHRNDNQNIFPVDRPLYRPVIWSWLNSNWFHSFIHSLLQACHFFFVFLVVVVVSLPTMTNLLKYHLSFQCKSQTVLNRLLVGILHYTVRTDLIDG